MEQTYRDSYQRTHLIGALLEKFDELLNERAVVSTAGRVMSRRKMGKVLFFNLADGEGNIQVFADISGLGQEEFSRLSNDVRIGDIVGVSGIVFKTRTEEKTIKCQSFSLLTSCLRSLPEKFHGLSDVETRYRQRYLDLIVNAETRNVFRKRSHIIKLMRKHLESNGFMEVETPIFQKNPCGASANPFVTHHDAKDIDLYLRISPETFLKQLIVGGMDRIYEIGKNFRNEGVDASHLQEFTMLEFYASYWNYCDNIEFVKWLIQQVLLGVMGSLELEYQGMSFDFRQWQTVEYRDLVLNDCGIDILNFETVDGLLAEITKQGVALGEIDPGISLGSLIDKLYKRVSRPRLIQPTVLLHHPAVLIPLARPNDQDPRVIDAFQILVNGWEIAKGYSELGDPILQRRLLEDQLALRHQGDSEAMFVDTDFLTSLEYGMPPVSGVGIGIDRLTAIATNQRNLADVVLFPLMG
ncbi:MAG: Lysine--tRNA ligase [Parcubacteria group bacterium ADurb.Bin326]|nr:MAG: Lysine--tRNA ligase [Parcubacteria group bacterium ADurb.Bin326]